ncbi:hypothetical protein C8R46DRAFT_1288782 [Mycena filopes]|nr:hypothetical protein C8R46DRAFT_1288782 [Mycena filopes]
MSEASSSWNMVELLAADLARGQAEIAALEARVPSTLKTQKVVDLMQENLDCYVDTRLSMKRKGLERLTEALRREVLRRITRAVQDDAMSVLSRSEIRTLKANELGRVGHLIDVDADVPVDDDVQAIAEKVRDHLGLPVENLVLFCRTAMRHNEKSGARLRRARPPSVGYAKSVLLELAKEIGVQQLDIQFAGEFLEAHASSHNAGDCDRNGRDGQPLFATGDSVDPEPQELKDEIAMLEGVQERRAAGLDI